MTKQEQMREVISDLRNESRVENLKANRKGQLTDVSLINQFKLTKHIPNKWFDWEKRVDSEIMIIGQDWGPFVALDRYIQEYQQESQSKDFDYNEFLWRGFSSRTEKAVFKYLSETYLEFYDEEMPNEQWDKIFFTMAVLFTRQGKHFRGSHNFDAKQSAEISYPYVIRQIEIVQPTVIITLGNLAFGVVNKYFELGYKDIKISNLAKDLQAEPIRIGKQFIIPAYHPAAHISPQIQKQIWRKIWQLV